MKSRGGKDGRTKTGRQFGLCHRIRRIPPREYMEASCAFFEDRRERLRGDGKKSNERGKIPPRRDSE